MTAIDRSSCPIRGMFSEAAATTGGQGLGMRTNSAHRRRLSARDLHAAAGGGALEFLEPRQLLAADPVTNNHPLWVATWGSAVVDGIVSPGEWSNAPGIVRTQAFHDSSVTTRIMYNQRGLFVSFDVRDQQLWSDGGGNGRGNRWEFNDDDAIALFIDPDNSRDLFMNSGDRFLAFNLGAMTGPTNGAGVVSRWESGRGDGSGGLTFAWPFAGPGGLNLRWATRVDGTVNNNSDVDRGWSSEVFIPWRALGRAAPAHGDTIGMNFTVMFDQQGGTWDGMPRRQDPNVNRRFGPMVMDDSIVGVAQSTPRTFGVLSGPVSNAEVMFVDPRSTQRPATIADLAAAAVTGYGARLEFTAPAGTLDGRGHVSRYEIRYSTSPIASAEDFARATLLKQNWTPHLRGQAETLRFGGLTPSTTYHFAVRAIDAAGTPGDFATTSFTTQSTVQDRSGGNRVLPSPGGNTFIRENGQPMVMVGEAVSTLNLFVRSLYTGPVYNPATGGMENYFTNPSYDGDSDAYFAAAQARGVTTLRVLLEWLDPIEANGNSLDGTYWLEYPRGNFNPHMKQFLLNMLEEADRHDMYLVLHPFNTFNYKDEFAHSAWSTQAGGPLTTINDFFQNPEVLDMAKNRLRVIADWIRESPFAHRAIGLRLLNEVDAGWTLNPKGDNVPGRLNEMLDRAKFITELGSYIKSYAPELSTFASVVGLSPGGPLNRALFLSDAIDAIHPHLYTVGTREPVNSPFGDKTTFAAGEYGRLASWWTTSRRDQRPIDNGEWGNMTEWWGSRPYYTGITPWANPSKPYSLATDEAIYRATSWTTLVSGFAGTGMRLPGPEVRSLTSMDDLISGNFDPYLLTPGMRRIQESVTRFVRDNSLGFDLSDFASTPLTARASVVSTTGTATVFGSASSTQALAYVRMDKNRPGANVSGGRLTIEGMLRGGVFEAQVWSGGPNAQILTTLSGLSAPRGVLTLNLPTFTDDLVLKIVSRTASPTGDRGDTISTAAGPVTVWLDSRGRPTLAPGSSRDGAPGQDLAAAARITASFRDVTAYAEADGRVSIVGVDAAHQLWVLSGRVGAVNWTSRNLTAEFNLPGIVGGLDAVMMGRNPMIVGIDGRGLLVGVQLTTPRDPVTGLPVQRWVFRDFATRGATTVLAGDVQASFAAGVLSVRAEARDGSVVDLLRNLPGQRWSTVVVTPA